MNREYPANQLESLPYAALDLGENQQHSSPALPFENMSTQGDQHEHREPVPEAAGTASYPGKADVGTTDGQQRYDSGDSNRGIEVRNKKPPRTGITDQVSSLLMDMLQERNGVLPGGHSLWHAITAVWKQRHPGKPVPKTKDFQWALSRMLKARSVLEHWHGFQDQSGLFSKCQILTLPHLDAFSAETLAVVEMIKQRHPQLSTPSNNSIERGEKRENRRGRRVLAGEVAQLDAPVYAAQSSFKRHHGVMNDETPSKRRKFAQGGIQSPAPLPAPLNDEYRARWASDSWLSGKKMDMLNHNKDKKGHSTHEVELQFLAPNTFLQDDWCAPDDGISRGMTPSFTLTRTTNRSLQGSPTAQGAEFAMASPVRCIEGRDGSWPYLGLPFFEEKSSNTSFTLCGWMPDMEWFSWADVVQDLDKRLSASEGSRSNRAVSAEAAYGNFRKCLADCLEIELNQADRFINAPPLAAGPYNLFVNLSAEISSVGSPSSLEWRHQELQTPVSFDRSVSTPGALSSSSDGDSDFGSDTSVLRHSRRPLGGVDTTQSKVKRVALITRPLTSISRRGTDRKEGQRALEMMDGQPLSQANPLAAFVVVRVLLGGADKAIDWGVLLHIFPNARLATLRKFWAIACKEQGAYIKKFTRDVQQRLIEALETQELPMVDFEDPIDYDWGTLIRWASRISRQEGYQIPETRELLAHRFSLVTSKSGEQDWCERYFHAQSSIFSRFEAVTSEPGALPVDHEYGTNVGKADVARSWIKSLCCTGEAKYSVRKIREKFLTLSGAEGTGQGSLLLKQAIEQLTAERVICRSKKTPLGGRPYRLSEWYLSTLNRVAQRPKYEEAAAFKRQMDAVFRRKEAFEVPYTLDDGSMMALTNLNAAARITIVPLDIPNIPLGFEPGNYESRKYPKSYYHFRLQAVPTEGYQFSEDVAVLRAVVQQDLPSTTSKGEIPQWIDFFGEKDAKRWSDILGALCFAYATKGPMTVRDVCNSLRPILDEFEAQLIIDWGLKTGVFEEAMGGVCVTVGEWWWLAVPWQYSR
jgi:transcription factor C subunit 3